MGEFEHIQSLIYVIRGQRVMLDFDLALIYQVETRSLNQTVKRNMKRFEGDEIIKRWPTNCLIGIASLWYAISAIHHSMTYISIRFIVDRLTSRNRSGK